MSHVRDGVKAWLLLGSNIGEREAHLRSARKALGRRYALVGASAVYETDAWGDRRQEPYLNQVVVYKLTDAPGHLHEATRDIEREMGRTEKGNFKPRKIDIDILFYGENGEQLVQSEHLVIPHPRIQLRRFVLAPLAELDSTLLHPVFSRTIGEMLEDCEDSLKVRIYKENDGASREVSSGTKSKESSVPGTGPGQKQDHRP